MFYIEYFLYQVYTCYRAISPRSRMVGNLNKHKFLKVNRQVFIKDQPKKYNNQKCN